MEEKNNNKEPQEEKDILEPRVSQEEAIFDPGYTKYLSKKIKKVKKKAIQYGITVPDLHYPLEKPSKPRLAFYIIGYIMIALGLASLVASVVLFIKAGIFSSMIELLSGSIDTLDPEVMKNTFGLSSVVGVGGIVLGIIIFIVLLVVVAIIVALISLGIKNLRLAKASRQEIAVGFEVTNYIWGIVATMLICVAIVVGLISKGGFAGVTVLITIIAGALVAVLAVLLTFLILQRKKEKVWFDTLDEDRKQDFLNLNQALKQYDKITTRNRTVSRRW